MSDDVTYVVLDVYKDTIAARLPTAARLCDG